MTKEEIASSLYRDWLRQLIKNGEIRTLRLSEVDDMSFEFKEIPPVDVRVEEENGMVESVSFDEFCEMFIEAISTKMGIPKELLGKEKDDE